MTTKKPTKKPAKKAARKPAYASQRAFRMFADACTEHFAQHSDWLNKLDANLLQQYRQHEQRLAEHAARLDAQQERLQQAMRTPKAEERESTIRALCKSEIMAHMQRLLGPERWKEMMAAPGRAVDWASLRDAPLPPTPSPEPMTAATLLLAAADKLASLQEAVSMRYGDVYEACETVRLEHQLRDRAENIKHGEPEV